jgi:hypothetical protein
LKEIPRRKLLGMTMAVFGFFTTLSSIPQAFIQRRRRHPNHPNHPAPQAFIQRRKRHPNHPNHPCRKHSSSAASAIQIILFPIDDFLRTHRL